MWSRADRARYERRGLRYPSDLTDAEWALTAGHIPPARRGGRRREVDVREVLQGILCVPETGCQWRHLPGDVPPRSTVWESFDLWRYDGTLDRIHEMLCLAPRGAAGRQASPRAGIIDSQSVKSAEEGGLRDRKRGSMRARRPGASNAMCSSMRSA